MHQVGPHDVADLHSAQPEMRAAVRGLVDTAAGGTLLRPPGWEQLQTARISWL
ncbi:hypothetical protein AB0I94_41570 [Streptomyces sp. NPDC050147]|uniref:hypothetical protein n=1 Tax=Streptomyces sp. NPDC050147 TaxID=3155513 RepID=UPI0034165669